MTKFLNIKTLNHFKFSMIELVLCLVVVIVSIVGVMGLFPVGLDSNKKTMGTSFATDAGEQFLRYNASKIRTDWTWTNVFANAKPGSDESHLSWNSASIFNAGNVHIKATSDLNEAVDNNSGFFCLQQLTGENVDFTAVMRVWKDLDINAEDNSEKVTLNVEVSWPASVPYDSGDRQKQQFSLEVFKAPDVSIDAANYGTCSLTRVHGGGFETTVAAAINADSTYAIQIIATYDGCTDADCQQITEYIIESDPTYTIDYIGGYGTTDATTSAATADADSFDGFKLMFNDGMGGNGYNGWFKVDYTVATLQNQHILVKTANAELPVSFTEEDFEFILNCVGTEDEAVGDIGAGTAADDVYTTDANVTLSVDMAMGTLSNSQKGKGVLANDESPNGELSAVLISDVKKGTLTLNANGSFVYIPDSDYVGQDKFIYKAFDGSKMTNIAKVVINVVDPCAGNSAPIFTDFTLADATVNTSYNASIASANLPSDSDGDAVTLSVSGLPNWLSYNAASKKFSGTPTAAGTFSWSLTATDTCNNATTVQVSLTVVDDTIDFEVDGDDVVPSEDVCATFTVLGAAMSGDCGTWQVTSRIKIGSETIDPWGNFNSAAGNVNDGNNPRTYTHSALIPANTAVSVLGKAYDCDGNSQGVIGDSSANGKQVVTLRNGDQAPTVGGYDGQASALDFLAGYINSNNTVVLEDNQAIYLMELYATDESASNFDLQDLVVLVTLNDASTCGSSDAGTPPGGGSGSSDSSGSDSSGSDSSDDNSGSDSSDDNSGSTVTGGDLNINPANSSGNIFELTTSNGTVIDMDDMSDYYWANDKTNTSYTGGATKVKIKVKSEHDGRTISINGVDVELDTNTRYTFSGDMTVNLRNTHDNPNSWGQAKGHWWISISGTYIEITPTP